MTEPVRLARRVSELLGCSRREAELYIQGGWVSVDGVIVQEPQARVSSETIAVDPAATPTEAEPVTLLLHQALEAAAAQPTAENHAADDPSAIRPLKRHFNQLTEPLPLEPGASGMRVLTQDWRVKRKLTEDAATIEHEYIVEVTGELDAAALKKLNHGLSFNKRALPPAKVSWQNETRLRFAVKGPQAGQIKFMCEAVGLQVRSLKRIRIGKLSMAKLPAGQWRHLGVGERV